MYVLVDAPAGGIHFAGWFLVGLGVVLDLSSYAQSRAYRSSGVRMIEAATLAIGLLAGGFWILAVVVGDPRRSAR